jgi:aminobenzoyl-glutamate utilization protein B
MQLFKKPVVVIVILLFLVTGSAFAGKRMNKCKNEALKWIKSQEHFFYEAAFRLWGYAETALLEHKSSKHLAYMFENRGFVVKRHVADMPTAFVATYGKGKPVVGILGEYDALPGLSQKAGFTSKVPIVKGNPGHGCGHNLFGVGSAAAAMAIKEVMVKYHIPGTIKFFGCPAEETVVGKVYMVKAGIFKGVDVCYEWHPYSKNLVSLGTSNALNNFEVTFHGKTAHSARDPWHGRSALDAVELMNVGVNYLREHVPPTVRIHYVIPEAGKAPNVVPDYAKVWYYVRGKDRKEVEEVYQRVLKIAEGAALMAGTSHDVYLITGVYNRLVNRELANVLHRNLKSQGAPQFSEKEQLLAKEIQRTLNKKEEGLSTVIEPLKEPRGYMGGGSTDSADVSWNVPTASLTTACWPLHSPGHSWVIVSSSGTSIGYKGMMTAAKVICHAGIETLLNPKIIKNAKKEFKEKTKDFIYKSAVPADQKPRLPKNVDSRR